MHLRNLALWCCTLLFVVSSEPRGNSTMNDDERNDSTVRYGIHINVTAMQDRRGDAEMVRYNTRENSTKNNDEYEFRVNSTNDNYENKESTQYVFQMHLTRQNHGGSNQTLTEIDANITEIDDKSISTTHEFHGNLMQIEDKSNLTSNELFESQDDNKNNIIPYEMCKNSTCIQLCCSFGNHLIFDNCVPGNTNYSFPDVYEDMINITDPFQTRSIGKKLNQVFQFVVYDPCKEFGRYTLEESDSFKFFVNGSLYVEYIDEIVESYCLAVLQQDKYETTICYGSYVSMVLADWVEKPGLAGVIVSLPFLLTTFVVYSILPEFRNMHGYTLRGYVGSLFIAHIFVTIVYLADQTKISDTFCKIFAFIIHFFFLASFFWLNVMCFDIWWTFRDFRSLQKSIKQWGRKRFVIYSIYVWGSPSIIVIIYVFTYSRIWNYDWWNDSREFTPVPIRPRACLYISETAKGIYFYLPMCITIICNICLFIATALKIVCYKKNITHNLRGSENGRHDSIKQGFYLYLKLVILMVINWKSLEIISWLRTFRKLLYSWHYNELLNTLQGLDIFIMFICKRKVMLLLLKRFGCQDRTRFCSPETRHVAAVTVDPNSSATYTITSEV